MGKGKYWSGHMGKGKHCTIRVNFPKMKDKYKQSEDDMAAETQREDKVHTCGRIFTRTVQNAKTMEKIKSEVNVVSPSQEMNVLG